MESYEIEYKVTFEKVKPFIDDIINRVRALPQGTQFKLCDLYTGIGWSKIPQGLRKKAGIYLTSIGQLYDFGETELVEIVGKTVSGQQIYKRV